MYVHKKHMSWYHSNFQYVSQMEHPGSPAIITVLKKKKNLMLESAGT